MADVQHTLFCSISTYFENFSCVYDSTMRLEYATLFLLTNLLFISLFHQHQLRKYTMME